MTIRCANRDVARHAKRMPVDFIQGYGNLCAFRGTGGRGHLPRRLADIYWARHRTILMTIRSYATPIAWLDECEETGELVWVVPSVNYSVTTAKHQGTLYQLSYHDDSPFSHRRVSVPYDVSMDEYLRVLSGKMLFTRNGTKPGPDWSLD